MSLIQIKKKTASDADALEILMESYALPDPLGVPVMLLDSQTAHGLGQEHVLESKKADMIEFIRRHAPKACSIGAVAATRMWVDDSFPSDRTFMTKTKYDAYCLPVWQDDCPKYADLCDDRANYERPEAAIVVTLNPGMTATEIYSHFLCTPLQDFSEFNAQAHFHTYWHEIGHAVGGDEPQSDTIAAVMCRRAFENNHVLQLHADQRAISAVTSPNNRQTYGWECLEATDYIAGYSSSVLDGMTEAEIENIKFQKFGDLNQTLAEVQAKLTKQGMTDVKDLQKMAEVAATVLSGGGCTETEGRILRRFQLACSRIAIGAAAYVEGNDLIDPELVAVTKEPPMTFTPGEFIPE